MGQANQDPIQMLLAAQPMDPPVTPDDVDRRINIVERALGALGPEDDWLRGILQNEAEQLRVLRDVVDELRQQRQTSFGERVDTTNLSIGRVGRANQEIGNDDTGTAIFDIQGGEFLAEVEANEDIDRNDRIVIIEEGNVAAPIPDIESVVDFTVTLEGISDIPMAEAAFEQTKAEQTVNIGTTETVLEVTFADADAAIWWEVGTTDPGDGDARYQYIVDSDDVFSASDESDDDPRIEVPLGLPDDLYQFPQPYVALSSIEIEASRVSGASSSTDFTSRIRYVEIGNRTGEALRAAFNSL